MSDVIDVVALVGSLRRDSYTRTLVESIGGLVPALKLDIVGVGDLPLYNQDDEDAAPASWTAFRKRVRLADAILFATPEYNRSIPGGLKNAIGVASRPAGASVWKGKPAAVLSATPGALGAFGASQHLRQCLMTLDMPTLAQPEMYIARVDKLFDGKGGFVDSHTRDSSTVSSARLKPGSGAHAPDELRCTG